MGFSIFSWMYCNLLSYKICILLGFLFPTFLHYFLAPLPCRAYRCLMSSSNMGLRFMSYPRKNLLTKFSSLFPISAIPSIKTVKGGFSCSCSVGCQFNLDDFSSKKRHLERVHSTNSNGKFSNKQFISVDPQLYEYILSNVREPEVLSFYFLCLSIFIIFWEGIVKLLDCYSRRLKHYRVQLIV